VYCDKTVKLRFIPVHICFCGHEIRLNCVCIVTKRLTYCPSVYRYASVLWQNGWRQVHTGSHLFCCYDIRLNCVHCDKTTDILSVRLSLRKCIVTKRLNSGSYRFTSVFAVMKLDYTVCVLRQNDWHIVRPFIATRVYCDKTAEVRFIAVYVCFCGHEIRLNCVCIVTKRLTCCPSVCLSLRVCIVAKRLKSGSYRFTSVLRSWNWTKLLRQND